MAEINTVDRQEGGSVVFTHGHRYPDNVQIVEQHHDASGKLVSAKVKWSGFAGEVLDVTATFDSSGNLVREEGFRAPEMKTPVKNLLKPLPTDTATSAPPAPAPTLAEGLRKIYPPKPDTAG